MAYYHDHELSYRNLERLTEQASAKTEPLANFPLRTFLEALYQQRFASETKPRCLEVGCGTGVIASFCASLGFMASGVDISPTAIRIAKHRSESLDLQVDFCVADALALPAELGEFDLIIDGACLHCLVFDEDRAQALESIRKRLRPSGLLIVQSAVLSQQVEFRKPYYLDESGILWYQTKNPDFQSAQEKNGEFWVPKRRIRKANELTEELTSHGFRIESERLLEGEPLRPKMLRLICELP